MTDRPKCKTLYCDNEPPPDQEYCDLCGMRRQIGLQQEVIRKLTTQTEQLKAKLVMAGIPVEG